MSFFRDHGRLPPPPPVGVRPVTASNPASPVLKATDSSIPYSRENLPALRFDSGDTIIKLCPTITLLVHSELLRTKMPVVATPLQPKWMKPMSTVHPATGKRIDVYTLALNTAEDTLLLGGKELPDTSCTCHDTPSLDCRLRYMHASALSEGYPEGVARQLGRQQPDIALEHIAILHHALIALLYEYPIPIEAFFIPNSGDSTHTHAWDSRDATSVIVGRLSTVPREAREDGPDMPTYRSILNQNVPGICAALALAEYYDCIAPVRDAFIKLLEKRSDLWPAVCERPYPWLRIAVKLQWDDLYFDAARHIMSRNSFDKSFDLQAHAFGITREEAKQRSAVVKADLASKVSELEHNLLRLQLTEHYEPPDRKEKYGFTPLLEFLSLRPPNRTWAEKASDRLDYMARSIYSEWLVDHIVQNGRTPASPANPHPGLHAACTQLVKSDGTGDISTVFGDRVPERFAGFFKLGKNDSSVSCIYTSLLNLVADAALVVEKAFARREKRQRGGARVTYRRAEFEDETHGFTWMGTDEEDVPWERDEVGKADGVGGKGKEKDDGVGVVWKMDEGGGVGWDVTPASEELLKLLGFA